MNRSSLINVLALVVSLGVVACSDDGSSGGATGGAQGFGGASTSGGQTGSGGAVSGGSVGSGGQTGQGGSTSSGGSTGTSGGASSGGSANGGTSSGGASGSGTGGRVESGGSPSSGGSGTGTGGSASGGNGSGSGGAAVGGSASGGSAGQAGGNAGASSTGGTGSGGYNPCKANPCVILPLGDSITHGFGSSDDAGYRSPLFKLIVAANQNVNFIGSLSNGPSNVSNKTFPKKHEGHDGISISGITGWVPPAKAFPSTPHIILLHIGTNDMTSNANPTTAANQLSTLITNLVNAAPDALIVVAKIVPLGYNNSNYGTYISKIGDVVKTFEGKHVVLVDMSTLPSSDIKGNGDVHPTDKGYSDMANLWYNAIKAYLPTAQ